MKLILGVLVGLVVAGLCVFGVEAIGHILYPPPPDINLADPADMARLMASVPPAALVFVAAAWFVGALLGAWIANTISRRGLAGWIVALLIMAGGVWTMVMIPHPAWMWAAGIALPLLAGWLAQRLAKARA